MAMSGLLSQREVATGTIVSAQRVRRSRTADSCLVRYAFTAKGGNEYHREIEVKAQEFEKYTEGQPIDIVYDPKNPDNNMLRRAVDDARAAPRRT